MNVSKFAKVKQNHAHSTLVALAHELHAGDVVMHESQVRVVLFSQPTSVDRYALYRLTFSDGSSALISADRHLQRLNEPSGLETPA